MSYAGTYGAAMTCEHDNYRPNCWRCNGSVARFARELPEREAHVAALPDEAPVAERVVTLYDASCPGCTWRRDGLDTKEAAASAYAAHAHNQRKVLADWHGDVAMIAEARRQGFDVPALPGADARGATA